MKDIQTENFEIPSIANFVQQGNGTPVVMIHGLAASLHDWDDLIPTLTRNGYASYALDLLGHGDSPHPPLRAYRMEWMYDHFEHWMRSLRLTEPAIIIGHSLGGYIALEYARRVSAWTKGLILVNPFYTLSQLPLLVRQAYRHPTLSGRITGNLPQWFFRMIVDITSFSMGHSNGASYTLPEHIRAQTALDYTRTAPGVYNVPNTGEDLTQHLHAISRPTLLVWGDHDQTLAPSSFHKMEKLLPHGTSKFVRAGHVPHQSNAEWFNAQVLEFLGRLESNS
ncbi:MAG: alpha/beta hydrolase [Anaerolineales bacterium]